MFADNTLTPREAVRLCALGVIAQGGDAGRRYADVARDVRHFITRITGPSLDLLAPSLELLVCEGLVERRDGSGIEDNATLCLTAEGGQAFVDLMTAQVRPTSDLSKLVTALKFWFLPLLAPETRALQVDILLDTCETELARLEDLRAGLGEADHGLLPWLDLEIMQARTRLDWLEVHRGTFAG